MPSVFGVLLFRLITESWVIIFVSDLEGFYYIYFLTFTLNVIKLIVVRSFWYNGLVYFAIHAIPVFLSLLIVTVIAIALSASLKKAEKNPSAAVTPIAGFPSMPSPAYAPNGADFPNINSAYTPNTNGVHSPNIVQNGQETPPTYQNYPNNFPKP